MPSRKVDKPAEVSTKVDTSGGVLHLYYRIQQEVKLLAEMTRALPGAYTEAHGHIEVMCSSVKRLDAQLVALQAMARLRRN